ncbi:hypothetical protein [Mycolicibacterium peregrinum]|uniref:hypothetical protein n=1 Tax=Mycolicibacterium peregrinum TaxID=43304 RepID=UPI003AAB1A4E
MAGNPANVRVWETGDLYIFDPAVAYVEATHLPADIDASMHAAWKPCGLMLGDPGVELPRDIEETDLNAWQAKRYRTKFKNGKVDGNATLLEDNDVVDDLLDAEGVPGARSRRVAMVFVDSDTGWVERRFTRVPASLFVENDNQAEEVSGRPVRLRFYPDANNKIFTIQKGVPATGGGS